MADQIGKGLGAGCNDDLTGEIFQTGPALVDLIFQMFPGQFSFYQLPKSRVVGTPCQGGALPGMNEVGALQTNSDDGNAGRLYDFYHFASSSYRILQGKRLIGSCFRHSIQLRVRKDNGWVKPGDGGTERNQFSG